MNSFTVYRKKEKIIMIGINKTESSFFELGQIYSEIHDWIDSKKATEDIEGLLQEVKSEVSQLEQEMKLIESDYSFNSLYKGNKFKRAFDWGNISRWSKRYDRVDYEYSHKDLERIDLTSIMRNFSGNSLPIELAILFRKLNQYIYEDERKFELSELRSSYQKLFEEDFAQYYLKLIADSNLCQLTNPQFVRFFKLLHSTVTVTAENYSEIVTEVKEFLYKEDSPYKMIQPFTSQLSIFDIFEEKDLVNILSSCIKTLERGFVVTDSKNKSEFVKRINLRDVSLSFDLMNNVESDSFFIISSEEIEEIFKRFKQFNFEENELVFYLNPFNSNDYTEEIAKGNFDDELNKKGFSYLKQLQKLVQTYSSEKNLNQMYIDDDSDIKTVVIENVKFFRKLFSELPVDEYLVPNQELAEILQEFYLIPKNKIKLIEEDYSENRFVFRMTQFKKQELKEFVSDLLNHSSETN